MIEVSKRQRLTVAQVQAAFRKLNAIPYRYTWNCTNAANQRQCCGMGAHLLATRRRQPGDFLNVADEEFGEDYVQGFVAGWDDAIEMAQVFSARELEGHHDGRRAAAAMGLIENN